MLEGRGCLVGFAQVAVDATRERGMRGLAMAGTALNRLHGVAKALTLLILTCINIINVYYLEHLGGGAFQVIHVNVNAR